MCMSALPQTHPIITPLWLNKTTTHTNIKPLFYPLVEFMVPLESFYGQISFSEAVRWLKCVFVWNRFWRFFQQISRFITVYFDSLLADLLPVWVKCLCLCVCFRCESCVDMLFVRGSGNCVQCNTPLRKSNFRVQLFEDPAIDKEVEIRKKVLKMYVAEKVSVCMACIQNWVISCQINQISETFPGSNVWFC